MYLSETDAIKNPEKTLYFLRGLPGSGKSTWAGNVVRGNKDWPIGKEILWFNKDTLRRLRPNVAEWDVVAMEREEVANGLGNSCTRVIVDNTHMNPIHERFYRGLAAAYGYEFLVIDHFMKVSLETCLERNAQRPEGERVPEEAIRMMDTQMRRKYAIIDPAPPFDRNLPDIIICDLDGTLAESEHRNPYDNSPEAIAADGLCERVNETIRGVRYRNNASIIFFSGRSSEGYLPTRKWLDKLGFEKMLLVLRAEGDTRDDTVVKYEMYNQHIRGKYNVILALDDRPKVVRMWNEVGLPVLTNNAYKGKEF